MNYPHSSQDCQNCPFKQDPHDFQHWVCIKCGRSHSFRNQLSDWLSQFVMIFLITLFGLLVLSALGNRNQPQDTLPAAESPARPA